MKEALPEHNIKAFLLFLQLQSTSESWGVNRHTARYTSPVSVVSQCKLVSGWGLTKRRSAPPYGPLWLWKDFFLLQLTILSRIMQ